MPSKKGSGGFNIHSPESLFPSISNTSYYVKGKKKVKFLERKKNQKVLDSNSQFTGSLPLVASVI